MPGHPPHLTVTTRGRSLVLSYRECPSATYDEFADAIAMLREDGLLPRSARSEFVDGIVFMTVQLPRKVRIDARTTGFRTFSRRIAVVTKAAITGLQARHTPDQLLDHVDRHVDRLEPAAA